MIATLYCPFQPRVLFLRYRPLPAIQFKLNLVSSADGLACTLLSFGSVVAEDFDISHVNVGPPLVMLVTLM